MTDTVICGNTSAGIVQTADSKQMHLFADDSKVLTVENGLLKIYARISRVKGSDIASQNTITLPLNGILFHVTGTTNIKHLTTTNWSEGSAVVLIFKGALTITNNAASPPVDTAPILLNNSQDFQVQVNSTLSLVYDGEYWFETGRKL